MAHDNSVIIPAMTASGFGAVSAGRNLAPAEALRALAGTPHLVCHAGFLIERLGHAASASRSDVRAALVEEQTPSALARQIDNGLSSKKRSLKETITNQVAQGLTDEEIGIVKGNSA